MRIYSLREDDWDAIIRLGNKVHGEGYLNTSSIEKVFFASLSRGLNCSYVVYDGERAKDGKLVGFRLTLAPGNWKIDEWCTPDKWDVPQDKICYFKSNTIQEEYRGKGIGSFLLAESIGAVKQMGAVAGVTHIWMESPGGSALKYFTKAGGQMIKIHNNRWLEDGQRNGYQCVHHGSNCSCRGAEMILYFGEQK